MADLADTLTPDTPVTWIQGTVYAVGVGTISVQYRGGMIYNVGVTDQYVPEVGDIVHCLSWPPRGVLAFGSTNNTPALPALPASSVGAVSVTSGMTWNRVTGTWSAGAVQSNTKWACWIVDNASLTALEGMELGRFEINLQKLTGGPPEFSLHKNPNTATALVTEPGPLFTSADLPVGVYTWLPLPLEWGSKILAKSAYGVAIGGGQYSGTYDAAGGQLRFTSI